MGVVSNENHARRTKKKMRFKIQPAALIFFAPLLVFSSHFVNEEFHGGSVDLPARHISFPNDESEKKKSLKKETNDGTHEFVNHEKRHTRGSVSKLVVFFYYHDVNPFSFDFYLWKQKKLSPRSQILPDIIKMHDVSKLKRILNTHHLCKIGLTMKKYV